MPSALALADDQALTKDQVCSSQWVNVTIKKVCSFSSASKEGKPKILESLTCDMQYVESIRADLQSKLNSVSAELSDKTDKLKDLRNVHVELESQKLLNQNLLISNEELKNKVADLERIVTSWSKASKLHDQIFSLQVPAQMKAIIGGDYETAAVIANMFSDSPPAEERIPPTAPISREEMLQHYFVRGTNDYHSELNNEAPSPSTSTSSSQAEPGSTPSFAQTIFPNHPIIDMMPNEGRIQYSSSSETF